MLLRSMLTPGSRIVGIKELRPVSIVSISHEDAVQPHLVRVGGRAMPETAGRSAWVAVVHATDGVCSDLVLFLASLLVPVEDVVANAVVVETVVRLVECWDGAVLGDDQAIYARAVPVEQLVVPGAGNDGLVATVQSAAAVPSVSLSLMVVDNPGLCHARGVCLGDAASVIETAAGNGGGNGGRGSKRQAGESGRLHGEQLSAGRTAVYRGLRDAPQEPGSRAFLILIQAISTAEEHFPNAKQVYGVSQSIHAF